MKLLRAATAILIAIAAALSTSGQVSAADAFDEESAEPMLGRFYVRGDAGWSFLEWDVGEDGGAVTAGLGVGYQWNDFLRTDARLDWSGPYDTGAVDLEATTLLGNAYIDLPLTSLGITPYVGAGLGWGWVESDAAGDDSGVAYSLMVGSAYTLSDHIELDAGYRYRGIGTGGDDATDHSITGGIRFNF